MFKNTFPLTRCYLTSSLYRNLLTITTSCATIVAVLLISLLVAAHVINVKVRIRHGSQVALNIHIHTHIESFNFRTLQHQVLLS